MSDPTPLDRAGLEEARVILQTCMSGATTDLAKALLATVDDRDATLVQIADEVSEQAAEIFDRATVRATVIFDEEDEHRDARRQKLFEDIGAALELSEDRHNALMHRLLWELGLNQIEDTADPPPGWTLER